MKKIFLGIILFFIAGFLNSESKKIQLNEFLPESEEFTATLMVESVPKEIEILADKFQKAITEKKYWFENYLKKYQHLKPKEILPYHENFNITIDEYHQIINMQENLTYIADREVDILVNSNANEYIINIIWSDEFRIKINIDRITKNAKSNFVEFYDYSEIDAKGSIIGDWNGLVWKYSSIINIDQGHAESFSIGKFKNKEKGIIRYKISSTDIGSTDLLLFYDLD